MDRDFLSKMMLRPDQVEDEQPVKPYSVSDDIVNSILSQVQDGISSRDALSVPRETPQQPVQQPAQQPAPEQGGFLQGLSDIKQGVDEWGQREVFDPLSDMADELIGVGENFAKMGSSFANSVPATFYGVANAIDEGTADAYAPAFNKFVEEHSYELRTDTAKAQEQSIAEFIHEEIQPRVKKHIVDPNMKRGEERPLLATIGETSVLALGLLAPVKGGQMWGRAMQPKVTELPFASLRLDAPKKPIPASKTKMGRQKGAIDLTTTGESKIKKKERGKKFMKEWEADTFGHPFNPSERIVMNTEVNQAKQTGDDFATIQISDMGDGTIRLNSIQATTAGEGSGSVGLKAITDMADKTGVDIHLGAKAYGTLENKMTTKQLEKWYERYGFEPTGRGGEMVRKAGTIDQEMLPAPEGTETEAGGGFDRTTTEMPFYDDMLRDPEYFKEKKGLAFDIVEMKPMDYMKELGLDVNDFQTVKDFLEPELVGKYADKMLAGEKFPMGTLVYDKAGKISTQEGRHRAIASIEAGLETMPVMVVKPVIDEAVQKKASAQKNQEEKYYEHSNQKAGGSIGALQERARSNERGVEQDSSAGRGVPASTTKQWRDVPSEQIKRGQLIPDEQNILRDIVLEHQREMGLPATDLKSNVTSSLQKQGSVAQAFELAPRLDDNSPKANKIKKAIYDTYPENRPDIIEATGAKNYNELVIATYESLLKESDALFDILPMEMTFHGGELEYPDSNHMRYDLRVNNHLSVFKGGEKHELLGEVDPVTGLSGNDRFRAQHDAVAHSIQDTSFGRKGEELGTDIHRQTLSTASQPAMYFETRGQNSVVNYSKLNYKLRQKQAGLREAIQHAKGIHDAEWQKELETALEESWIEMQYAKQKAGILPAQMLDPNFDGVMPESIRAVMSPKGDTSQTTHFSTQGEISKLTPDMQGTGAVGKEGERVAKLPESQKGMHLYMERANPEAIVVGQSKSIVEPSTPLKGLYDLTKDTEGFRDLAKEYDEYNVDNAMTNLVHGAGYSGYHNGNSAYAFGDIPVTKLEGLEGLSGKDKLKVAKEVMARPKKKPVKRKKPAVKATKVEGQTISSRYPTAVGRKEDPLGHDVHVGYDSMLTDKKALKHNMSLVKKYDNWRADGIRGLENQVEHFVDHMKDNILFMHDLVPEDIRIQTRLWYDGANTIASGQASKYGISLESASAVYASLSPQKDWYMNVSLGDRVMDIYHTKANTPWDKKLDKKLDEKFPDTVITKGGKEVAKPNNVMLKKEVRGKKLSELNTDRERAMWVRNYDETYGDRRHRTVTPTGEFGDYVRTSKKDKKTGEYNYSGTGWGSLTEISKAISVLRDPSIENISTRMGNMHKVRSFYNNILSPNAPEGFATIDTHAVSANLMQPYAGTDMHVMHNFGSGGGIKNSSLTGNQGIYGLHHEALRRASEERDLLPREMQSITWEAIRGLFNNKSERVKKSASLIWKRYKKGEITQREAQELIVKMAGGVNDPTWLK